MRRNRRNQKGSVILEFVCCACLLVIAAVIGVNCGLVAFAAGVNSTACRDAVRAASLQSNAANAQAAARAAVARFSISSPILTSPEIITEGTAFEYQPYLDANGQIQRERWPYVRVTTAVTATMPAPIMWSGTSLTGRLQLRQMYLMPLIPAAGT